MSFSHKISDCTSTRKCEHCQHRHHSLLCLYQDKSKSVQTKSESKPAHSQRQGVDGIPGPSTEHFTQNDLHNYSTMISKSSVKEITIFPTVLVNVINSYGKMVTLRALIDKCSDACYVTEQAVISLGCPIQKTEVQTTGLGGATTGTCTGISSFDIQSIVNPYFKQSISAYVLDKISPNRPVQSFKLKEYLPQSMQLGDPCFDNKAKIDLLLSGSIDAFITKSGTYHAKNDNIIFTETELGWIASGSVPEVQCLSSFLSPSNCLRKTDSDYEIVLKELDNTLKRFWELEEIPFVRKLTAEEIYCEEFYEKTTIRLISGRYCVRLPLKAECKFSNMRQVALKRYNYLEKRLSKNSDLKVQYSTCIQEYIDLGHMTEVDPGDYPDGYYIPHHCVIKESSTTTKLRVVFDASARDNLLQSLNDNMFNGPRLQPDLIDLLLQFRTFEFVFTGDITKMYRQILVNSADRKYQLVLWRTHQDEEIKTYTCNSVTFGTKTAPYLAVKTLLKVADDEKSKYPKGYECVKRGFYVDDCIFGADTIAEAIEYQQQTFHLLSSAGLYLRKWSSNSREILSNIPESDRENSNFLEFDKKSSVKTLGVQWFPEDDYFKYKFSLPETSSITKRSILSDVAMIFDPLGWISPCLVTAKLLIQQM